MKAIVHEWHVPILDDQIIPDDLDQDKPPSSQHKDQEEDPQDDVQDHDPTESGSSSTPIDRDIEEKRDEEKT